MKDYLSQLSVCLHQCTKTPITLLLKLEENKEHESPTTPSRGIEVDWVYEKSLEKEGADGRAEMIMVRKWSCALWMEMGVRVPFQVKISYHSIVQ